MEYLKKVKHMVETIKSKQDFEKQMERYVKALSNVDFFLQVLQEVVEGTCPPIIEEAQKPYPGFALPGNDRMFVYAVFETMDILSFTGNTTVGQTPIITGQGKDLYYRLEANGAYPTK